MFRKRGEFNDELQKLVVAIAGIAGCYLLTDDDVFYKQTEKLEILIKSIRDSEMNDFSNSGASDKLLAIETLIKLSLEDMDNFLFLTDEIKKRNIVKRFIENKEIAMEIWKKILLNINNDLLNVFFNNFIEVGFCANRSSIKELCFDAKYHITTLEKEAKKTERAIKKQNLNQISNKLISK